MHIILGLIVFAVLLYFWLIGHWFARILVTLALGLCLFIVVTALMPEKDPAAGKSIIGLLFACSSWFIAGIPTYYWRQRMRMLLVEEDRRASGARVAVPPVSAHQREWEAFARRH